MRPSWRINFTHVCAPIDPPSHWKPQWRPLHIDTHRLRYWVNISTGRVYYFLTSMNKWSLSTRPSPENHVQMRDIMNGSFEP